MSVQQLGSCNIENEDDETFSCVNFAVSHLKISTYGRIAKKRVSQVVSPYVAKRYDKRLMW